MLEVLLCPGSSHIPCHLKDHFEQNLQSVLETALHNKKIPALVRNSAISIALAGPS